MSDMTTMQPPPTVAERALLIILSDGVPALTAHHPLPDNPAVCAAIAALAAAGYIAVSPDDETPAYRLTAAGLAAIREERG